MTELWWTIQIAYWFRRMSDMTIHESWRYAKQMDREPIGKNDMTIMIYLTHDPDDDVHAVVITDDETPAGEVVRLEMKSERDACAFALKLSTAIADHSDYKVETA